VRGLIAYMYGFVWGRKGVLPHIVYTSCSTVVLAMEQGGLSQAGLELSLLEGESGQRGLRMSIPPQPCDAAMPSTVIQIEKKSTKEKKRVHVKRQSETVYTETDYSEIQKSVILKPRPWGKHPQSGPLGKRPPNSSSRSLILPSSFSIEAAS